MARILIGNIRGPQGPSGPAGAIGPKGDKGDPGQGATLINSLVAATAGMGALDAYQGKVLDSKFASTVSFKNIGNVNSSSPAAFKTSGSFRGLVLGVGSLTGICYLGIAYGTDTSIRITDVYKGTNITVSVNGSTATFTSNGTATMSLSLFAANTYIGNAAAV